MEQAGGERTSTKFYWRVTDRQTNGHLATVYSALPCKIQSVGLFVFVQSHLQSLLKKQLHLTEGKSVKA